MMSKRIRFGGRTSIRPASKMKDDALASLLGKLSWKYVKQEAEFDYSKSATDVGLDELKENIAHWAGRVWVHSNSMPSGTALRAFDLMSLQNAFRQYIRTHGEDFLKEGLTVEEIWASQQLYSATPMLTIIARRHADLLTHRMEPTRVQSSQAIIWTLGALCLQMPDVLGGQGFNVLVTDDNIGHTISIMGLNGVDFEHPRGTRVRAGWFSFHDPWPARSLLAPERNFSGVRALEDIAQPPLWLISPEDLDRVIVGYVLPVDVLPAFLDIFRTLDIVEEMHAGKTNPLWIDDDSSDPEQPFATLLALSGGVAPTTAERLLGLGRARLLMGDLAGAVECFQGACNLGLPGAAQSAGAFLETAGHHALAKKWLKRRL